MERNDTNNNRNVVKEQILAIRDSGQINMFDCRAVRDLAQEWHFHELVCFIKEQPGRYFKFIMIGDEDLLPE